MEGLQEIPCVVQSPVSLSVSTYSDGRTSYDGRGSATTTAVSCSTSDRYPSHHTPHSGCHVMDVELHQPCSQISSIRFRNRYTYAITVLYQTAMVPERKALTQDHTSATAQATDVFESHISGCSGEWKVGVAKHILMPSCHCDSPDAQKWVELGQSAFQGKLEGVLRLRLILRQPSPHWRQFGIENLSCYHHDSNAASRTHLSVVSHDHEGVWSSRNQMGRVLEVDRRAQSRLKSEEVEKESGFLGSQCVHNRRQP